MRGELISRDKRLSGSWYFLVVGAEPGCKTYDFAIVAAKVVLAGPVGRPPSEGLWREVTII